MHETSIIMGAYNVSSCYSFSQSMNSILNQTYTDFELIICDDGSNDNTWELLNEYAQRDNRVKLLRNSENKGLAASLNRCIEMAEGEFIARHDCDDYCDSIRLYKQIEFLKSHPDISMVGCNVYLFNENGVWGKEVFPSEVKNTDFLFSSPYKHGAVVFRKNALISAGGYRVAKETRRAEDYDLFMTIATFGKGANLDEFLYYFCEDYAARKRRKYIYRIDEVKVRYIGFKRMNLLPRGILYVVKPLIVGLIPGYLLEKLKEKKYKRKLKVSCNDNNK